MLVSIHIFVFFTINYNAIISKFTKILHSSSFYGYLMNKK